MVLLYRQMPQKFPTMNAMLVVRDFLKKIVSHDPSCSVVKDLTILSGGGADVWTVYLTGTQSSFSTIASGDGTSSTAATSSQGSQNSQGSGSPTNSQSPSVITKAGETIVVTASGQSTGSSDSGSGHSKVGIAVGIVAGVVGLAALLGAGFFFYRHKKRQSVEEEFRRSAAINNFVTPGKAKSEGSGSLNDSRLDPSIMAHRRMSDGSIADERDFSRRILHVRSMLIEEVFILTSQRLQILTETLEKLSSI